MKRRPIIGITLDAEEGGSYSKLAWYALRHNYADVIAKAGGLPLPLPHFPELAQEYAEKVDGLLITGGRFDVDPALFGATSVHPTVIIKPSRTQFEIEMVKLVYEAKKPILGICGGMQLLNVVLGGTLIQHIPDEIPNCLAHEQPNPRTEAGHAIEIYRDSLLHDVAQTQEAAVNSAHHQAVKIVAPSMRVNAVAPDGVIEGIEDLHHPFCLGVQWHPEYEVSDVDTRIIHRFIKAISL
jgi:putative glutamine amidotransferase